MAETIGKTEQNGNAGAGVGDGIESAVSLASAAETLDRLISGVERVVVGQRGMIEGLLLGLLADGHVLLEGVPGLAKTLTVHTLARLVDARFARVQFTPDLLPADLIGTLIFQPKDGSFAARRGPIFANIVLADEINRAPAKVQSALLEAMQERRVTIGEETMPLPEPFLVLATQNPIEQEGTYPLPEAQVDRFMLKVKVAYPTREEERRIVDRMGAGDASDLASPGPVMTLGELSGVRGLVSAVRVDERARDYIVELVRATREPGGVGLDIGRMIEFGASPRASIALARASRAWAVMRGRGFVTAADVKAVAPMVLRHRVVVSYEGQAEGADADAIVRRILDHVPVR